MPASEARVRANAKYNLKAYDRVELKVSKGRNAELQARAAAQGESLNGFVNRAIDEAIERDANEDIITFLTVKGGRRFLEHHIDERGMDLDDYINRAISEAIKRDNAKGDD